MAITTFHFALDKRRAHKDGTYPLVAVLHVNNANHYAATGLSLLPEHWDAGRREVVGRRDSRSLNSFLATQQLQAEQTLRDLALSGRLQRLTPKKLLDTLLGRRSPDADDFFLPFFDRFTARKANAGTRQLYESTRRRMLAFDPSLPDRRFEEIGLRWLNDFEAFLARTRCKNSRNIPLRNIRAVFNAAIDEELTDCYPFRRFKIRPEPTRKRSIAVDDLRRLFTMDVEPWIEPYRDWFKLIFMLIGINCTDLYRPRETSRASTSRKSTSTATRERSTRRTAASSTTSSTSAKIILSRQSENLLRSGSGIWGLRRGRRRRRVTSKAKRHAYAQLFGRSDDNS